MKTLSRRTVLRGLGASAALCCLPWKALAAQWPGATRVLNMTTRYELAHPVTKDVFLPWIQEVRERSHNRVDLRLFPTNSLCFDADIYQCIQMDSVSLGVVSPGTQVPPFPVNLLLELVQPFPSAEVGSRVTWELFTRHSEVRAEFRMVYPLWAWVSSPYYVHTVKAPVTSPTGLAKRRIGVMSGVPAEILKALGAHPIEMPVYRMAQALRARLIEGIVSPLPPLPSFGLTDLLHYTTDLPLSVVTFFAAMNREVWSALPQGDKRLLESMSGDRMSTLCGRKLDEGEILVRQAMQAQGHEFVPVSEASRDAWLEPLNRLRREYVERLLYQGVLKDAGILNTIQELSDEYAGMP